MCEYEKDGVCQLDPMVLCKYREDDAICLNPDTFKEQEEVKKKMSNEELIEKAEENIEKAREYLYVTEMEREILGLKDLKKRIKDKELAIKRLEETDIEELYPNPCMDNIRKLPKLSIGNFADTYMEVMRK